MRVAPARTPSYWSFGYIPTGRRRDLLRRWYGFPNLAKRVQAPAILRALDLKATERCCDLGCGSGFVTIELAKVCQLAIGIDINPVLASIPIPDLLKGRLQYIVQDARVLPIPTNSLDVVLCSEVLMMITDPSQFLSEVRRVLKSGGRLVVVNGLGHVHVRQAYERGGIWLRLIRAWLGHRFPETYEQYYSELQRHFGTAIQPQTQMFYPRLLEHQGFEVTQVSYSPSEACASYLSWLQFLQFSRTGRGVTDFTYLRFLIASALNKFGGCGSPTSQIVCARVLSGEFPVI